jgi:hypothetical protein
MAAATPSGKASSQRHHHGEEGADHGAPDTGKFRLAAGADGEEQDVGRPLDAIFVRAS